MSNFILLHSSEVILRHTKIPFSSKGSFLDLHIFTFPLLCAVGLILILHTSRNTRINQFISEYLILIIYSALLHFMFAIIINLFIFHMQSHVTFSMTIDLFLMFANRTLILIDGVQTTDVILPRGLELPHLQEMGLV